MIRDFIYLDIERLKSILAQIENGLIESSKRVSGHGKELGAGGKSSILGFLAAEGQSKFLWQNEESETKALHDDIYGRIEKHLTENDLLIRVPGTIQVDDVKTRDFEQTISETSFLLLKGYVEINDYEYMRKLFEKFNELMTLMLKVQVTQDSAYKNLSRNEQKKELAELTQHKSLDENLQKLLILMIDTFFRGKVIVRMTPFREYPSFRAVGGLKPQYLRDDIDSIIHKYGTAPEAPWRMFVQVAAIPSQTPGFIEEAASGNTLESTFRAMFAGMRTIESLAVTVTYPEISITPIAIYRE